MAEFKKRFKEQKPDDQEFEKNVNNAVKYLNHAFATALQKAGSKGVSKCVRENKDVGKIKEANAAYLAQVEFTYLIDEVQRGPACMVQKNISEINELIAAFTDASITVKE